MAGSSWRRWVPGRTRLVAAGLGAFTVCGFAPFYWYPLPLLTVALLLWMWTRSRGPRDAAMLGWSFGLGFFLAGVSWVYVSLHTFGAMPAPVAATTTLLFCAFLALFPALVGYCFGRVNAPLWARLTLLTPALWALSEWVRGWIFTGFPWLALGYSQVPASPLAGYAPVLGVFGLSVAVVLTSGLLVLLADRARQESGDETAAAAQSAALLQTVLRPSTAAIAVLWLVGYGLSLIQWTQPQGKPVEVALLQGNIPQDIKWTPEGLRTTLRAYHELATSTRARLIVFPETALPLFLHQVPPDYLQSLAAHAQDQGGDVLIGVPERLPSGEYYNSVISVGTSPLQAYRKTHLVPFGEFIPLRSVLGPIVGALAIPLQDFSRGSYTPQPLEVAGERVALNICYEDVFGEEIIRQLPAATLLVNVSNVAWFGRSGAPMQHLQISQTRALETGRYMLRATNTGMTAIIDTHGEVVKAAPQFETAALVGSAQGHTGTTPYVRWGNWAVLLLCAALVLAAALIKNR